MSDSTNSTFSFADLLKVKKIKEEINDLHVKYEKVMLENNEFKAENQKLKKYINEMNKINNEMYHKTLNSKTNYEAKVEFERQKYDELVLEYEAKVELLRNHKPQVIEYSNEKRYLQELLNDSNKKIQELKNENIRYRHLFPDEIDNIIDLKEHIFELENEVIRKEHKIIDLDKKIEDLNRQYIILDDEVLYQSFGLYTPLYNFVNSEMYLFRLEENRLMQKEMIKSKIAAICYSDWEVNGSKAEGKKQTDDNLKQILRSFNIECDNIINNVKFNNFDSMEKRITKAFEQLNKLNESNDIKIQFNYLELKFDELRLAYEYQLKKQQEKDELRMIREQQREEAKLLKEIEEKRKEIEKEQQHYNNVLRRINEQIDCELDEKRLEDLFDKKEKVENNLIDLDVALKEIDYREANQKAGYVYIISNIGSFGENVYKIGMTRRIDPNERIDELGGASVPFKFDIHAMIFSDDAPRLENMLHKAFEHKKVNAINGRKEFFNVTLDEIEEVVKANYDRTVDFTKTPIAQQYRESIQYRMIKTN